MWSHKEACCPQGLEKVLPFGPGDCSGTGMGGAAGADGCSAGRPLVIS